MLQSQIKQVAVWGNTRRPAARSPAAVSARRAPTEPRGYSHQLPPVRPISSPFSEFHRKLFHPPSSLLEGILDFFFFFFFLVFKCPVKVAPLLVFYSADSLHQAPKPPQSQRNPARCAGRLPNINRSSSAPPAKTPDKLPSRRVDRRRANWESGDAVRNSDVR